jgi:hypothetical protein
MNPHTSLTRLRVPVIFAILTAVSLSFAFSKEIIATAKTLSGLEAPMSGAISGRVFQDFNGNGTYDTTTTILNNGSGSIGVAIDLGVAGVTVTVYDSAGAARGSATTAASGSYAVSATGTGPYRVEFTGLPIGFQPSVRSTDSTLGGTTTNAGSTVQFVNDLNTSDVNLGVNYPTDYSQNNPEVVASLYAEGSQTSGVSATQSVLVSFPYSAGSSDTGTGATESLFDTPTVNPLDLVASQVGEKRAVYMLVRISSGTPDLARRARTAFTSSTGRAQVQWRHPSRFPVRRPIHTIPPTTTTIMAIRVGTRSARPVSAGWPLARTSPSFT